MTRCKAKQHKEYCYKMSVFLFHVGQASPDSLDIGDENGDLVNGTGEEHPDSEGDRRPSLNASTPDDDLSVRERTSTVPPARTIAQVYMDPSTAAQSQPDLLGIPYSAHENVLIRKRTINSSLSISPEHLNSRLSMPPFVFSSTSLRSVENTPSTSSSYANDMAMRAGGNDEESTRENSSADDTSLNEQVNRNLNEEMTAASTSEEINTRGECDSPTGTIISDVSSSITGTHQLSSEAEGNQNSTPVSGSEHEVSIADIEGENIPSSALNSDTVMNMNEANDEIADGNNDITLEIFSEQNSQTSEQERIADALVTETLPETTDLDSSSEERNDGNNQNVSEINEFEELEPSSEAGSENANTETQERTTVSVVISPQDASSLIANSFAAQEPSSIHDDSEPSGEHDLPISGQLSLHEEVNADLSNDEINLSLVQRDSPIEEGLSLPVNEQSEETSSANSLENCNDERGRTNQPTNDTCTLSDVQALELSSVSLSATEHSPGPRTEQEISDETQVDQSSIDHMSDITPLFTRFGGDLTRESFMDLESEPDIMNAFSLSHTTSDVVMPTQSADIEGTSPRRTVGTCNLRTLFQIPDSENNFAADTAENSFERIQQVSTSLVEGVSEDSDVLQNIDTMQRVAAGSGDLDGDTTSSDAAVMNISDLDTQVNSSVSELPPSNSRTSVESMAAGETMLHSRNDEVDYSGLLATTSSNEQRHAEQSSADGAMPPSTQPETSDTTSTNDERPPQRSNLISPIPSITHVRYLRSKNVSIRLPSRTPTPLPVVHVVPPNVPVSSSKSDGDLPSSIEAEPVVPATRLDSSVVFNRESNLVGGRSLARDVFDAPVGVQEAVNAGASTSHSSHSEDITGAQRASVSHVPHSASKRRTSCDSSQSGSVKNKKKSKTRNRSSQSSLTDRTDGAGPSSRQAQSRRRASEERENRNLPNTTEEANDESTSSHRPASIYVQISDFARDEDVLDEPLPPRKLLKLYCNNKKVIVQSVILYKHQKVLLWISYNLRLGESS